MRDNAATGKQSAQTNTFRSPRDAIGESLTELAERLEPIIAARLQPIANALPWTAILTALDESKGRGRHAYVETDLQAQLRVLTERLGSAGFPFDRRGDHATSVHAGELRLYRNAWAHMNELGAADAFRVSDTARRLLADLGDDDGAAEFLQRSERAARALIEALPDDAPTAASQHAAPAEGSAAAWIDEPASEEDHDVEPPQEALEPDALSSESARADSITPIAERRLEYVPWSITDLGAKQIIDDLPKLAAKHRVWAAASEIADFEAPVSRQRLVTLVARAFGYSRIGEKKRKQIERQIGNVEDLTVDADGFVWTADIDPATWTGFRPNPGSVARNLADISSVEIANALRFLSARDPDCTDEELDRHVLATFGKLRRTKQAQVQLDRARRRIHQ